MKKNPERNASSRPFLLVNMAMTADGKIATANRAVSSFGSAADQRHLFELRATADAVMAGARTVDLNPVNLGPGGVRYQQLRKKRGLAEYNVRVIVSRSGSVNPDAEIFRHRFSPILILTTEQAGMKRISRLRGKAEAVEIFGKADIDFSAALAWLRQEWGVQRLLCEGGGELNDALFRQDLVDELHLTVCPIIFGGRTAPTIADGAGAETLREAGKMALKSARRKGDEMFFVYQRLVERERRLTDPALPSGRRAKANRKGGSSKR